MPLIKIQTNAIVSPQGIRDLLSESTTITADILNKPESIFMVSVETEMAMAFGGEFVPTALFEIEALDYDKPLSQGLVTSLTQLAEQLLDVAPERVFVKLISVPRGNWAGNGKIY